MGHVLLGVELGVEAAARTDPPALLARLRFVEDADPAVAHSFKHALGNYRSRGLYSRSTCSANHAIRCCRSKSSGKS